MGLASEILSSELWCSGDEALHATLVSYSTLIQSIMSAYSSSSIPASVAFTKPIETLHPSWYAALLWPVSNVLTAIRLKSKAHNCGRRHSLSPPKVSTDVKNTSLTPESLPQISPVNDVWGHLSAVAGSLRSFFVALLCIYVIHHRANEVGEDSFDARGYPCLGDYPAFGRAVTYKMEWIVPIVSRNMIGTILVAGLWDWFL